MRLGSRPAGGGGDEADADDAVAEELGVLLGERDDRHAAHRVADQDHRSLGHDVLQHHGEVTAELVDGGVVLGRAPGASVRTLVVVDRADQPAVGRALEVPAVEVERVAVAEDDRRADWPDGGPTGPARPPRHAVGRRRRRPGSRRASAGCRTAWRRSSGCRWRGSGAGCPARRRPLPGRPHRRRHRGSDRERSRFYGVPAEARARRAERSMRAVSWGVHSSILSLSTCRRVNRPPIRVTIS